MSTLLIMLKMLAYILAIGILGLVVFVYLPLYVFQERLLFLRTNTNPQLLMAIQKNIKQLQTVNLQTPDKVNLQGWLVNPPKDGEKRPLLIYFGGNAEDVMTLIPVMAKFSAWTVLLMNYRGYGESEGQPSESAFYQDALQLFDHFSQQKGIDSQRIVLMGRSLGSGVAIYAAHQRAAAGVILISPYQSLVKVAQQHYPIVPVNYLLRHRFESEKRVAEINAPLLMIAAEHDEVIPVAQSLELSAQWAGKVEQVIMQKVTHNDISEAVGYWQTIERFLDRF